MTRESAGSVTTVASTTATEFAMPSVVGGDLQAAQDAVQAAADDPMFFSVSHDLSGQERGQMVDSSWKVCTQEPAAGATFKMGTKVDFGVVKLDEACLDETPILAPPTTSGANVSYANCAEVKAAGAAPLHRGEPGYSSKLDRDGDGIACET